MLYFFIALLIIVADIVTKIGAHYIPANVTVLGDWLALHLTYNTGVAFGTPLPGIAFVVPVILMALLFFVIRKWRTFHRIEKISYLMIIMGGSLNACERAVFGSVTDFISVQYFSVFNIADISITIGVLLLIWCGVFGDKTTK